MQSSFQHLRTQGARAVHDRPQCTGQAPFLHRPADVGETLLKSLRDPPAPVDSPLLAFPNLEHEKDPGGGSDTAGFLGLEACVLSWNTCPSMTQNPR